ncbi:predicted protein [Arabidopsis lyrata subsp. lyrata]|uniref:Predicted protein n=1 Tax=Arabidopsis lyrata subsp. lyrata TaxID=81972 RepID=D7LJL6_ARALL|nr:predicted protein [Arabidopsis lyrata subsp. lyrata]
MLIFRGTNQRWWASRSNLVEEWPCWYRAGIDSPPTQNCSALSFWPHGYEPIVYDPFENLKGPYPWDILSPRISPKPFYRSGDLLFPGTSKSFSKTLDPAKQCNLCF